MVRSEIHDTRQFMVTSTSFIAAYLIMAITDSVTPQLPLVSDSNICFLELKNKF